MNGMHINGISFAKKLLANHRWLFTCVIVTISGTIHAAPLKVTLFSPEPPENLFWGQAMRFADAVAEDLDIQLDIVHPGLSGLVPSAVFRSMGRKIIDRDVQPDYLLTGHWTSPEDLLETVAKQNNIRLFTFNTSFSTTEMRLLGEPRGKYENWIGQRTPDDHLGGYDLADILIEKANTDQANNKPKIVALSGSSEAQASKDRLAGLQNRVDSDRKLSVSRVFTTTWTRESAREATQEMLSKYPDTDIVWTVSGEVALGSIEQLKASDQHPERDILVGSFDWSSEGLNAVKNGEIAVSIGGHFMEAGWALVMIYDYHNGIDFKNDPGIKSVTSMQPITISNIDEYLERLGDRNWSKIDFSEFSKAENQQLEEYDFSLGAILSSMK
jgi:ABC-type sugar transport system substrate-binding protein